MKRFFFDAESHVNPIPLLNTYQPEDLLVCYDPGEYIKPSQSAFTHISLCKSHNINFAIYLMGPGMWSWSKQEQQQIERFAENIGINTSQSDWYQQWMKWGWYEQTLALLRYYAQMGAYACEIDNLDSVFDDRSDSYISFYQSVHNYILSNNIPRIKIILKNLSESTLSEVFSFQDRLLISPDLFAPWGMFESGTGDPTQQFSICRKRGIYAVTPSTGILPTHKYGVIPSGVPSIEKV